MAAVNRSFFVLAYLGILSGPVRRLICWLCLTAIGPLLAAESSGDASPPTRKAEGEPASSARREALRLIHGDINKNKSADLVGETLSTQPKPTTTTANTTDESILGSPFKLEELELTYHGSETEVSGSLTETADGILKLRPFVTSVAKRPDLTPPRESPFQKFTRTGTISQHVGEKITTKLWMNGDEGLMLRFSW